VGSGPSISALAEGIPFAGYEKHLIESSLVKVGIDPDTVHYTHNSPSLIEELNSLPNLEIIVTMGEKPLNVITGKYSIDKWQLSPLDTVETINAPKCLPTFDYKRFNRQYEYRLFYFMTCQRLSDALKTPGPWVRKERIEHINPDPLTINRLLRNKPILSVDIETSCGTINTLGLAWSANEAIAIRIDPGLFAPHEEFQFWKTIARYMEDPKVKKILQNNIYEGQYFARYGIKLQGIWHDTMWAQKLLYPEFKQGLDMVGRFYTNEIYWKEDGKDWNNINNWLEHLRYNISDTINTYEAAMKQREELAERNMLALYYNYMIKLAEPLLEMCTTGLRVDQERKLEIAQEVSRDIDEIKAGLSQPINHRSPKQKVDLFKAKGYKLPTKKNSKGKRSESADELSLKKLRLKYPDDPDIAALLRLAKLEKFKSSYIDFDYHDDGIVRYSIKGSGTETLRFASGLDAWEMGFNAQTIPKKAKKFFLPPKDHIFLQVDLSKAESYYVAYKARETRLIEMLRNGEDIHSYVASHIYGVPIEQVIAEAKSGDNKKRQVGKKSGHGANYSMGPVTFQASCLKEDLIITKNEAENVLSTYHRLFPGIRRWHQEVKAQIRAKGYLENPFGFRRYFYGRIDDNTFREAYAFEPQSTIPMIMNRLLLHTVKLRNLGLIDFNIHLQVHDSLVFSVLPDQLPKLVKVCQDLKAWQPGVDFTLGKMIIPIDLEVSHNLGDMQPVEVFLDANE
jgi:DNA polymerase-1